MRIEDLYEGNHLTIGNYIEIEEVHGFEEAEIGPSIMKCEFVKAIRN